MFLTFLFIIIILLSKSCSGSHPITCLLHIY